MLTSVAKLEMSVTAEKSVMSAISRVLSNDCNRSAQNLRVERQRLIIKATLSSQM